MTREEELSYLFGILSEASKWTASPDDPRDLVRIEVEERVANLIKGVTPEPDENGLIQSSIHPDVNPVITEDDFKALEAARLNAHLASVEKVKDARSKWERGKVRVFIDGRHVWKKRSECVKQPRDNSKGGAAWKWAWLGPQGKQEQCDAMWENHEAGND